MQITQVLDYFGKSQTKVAQALDIAQSNVARWVKAGKVPKLKQLQLESVTGGALKAEKGILPRKQKASHA